MSIVDVNRSIGGSEGTLEVLKNVHKKIEESSYGINQLCAGSKLTSEEAAAYLLGLEHASRMPADFALVQEDRSIRDLGCLCRAQMTHLIADKKIILNTASERLAFIMGVHVVEAALFRGPLEQSNHLDYFLSLIRDLRGRDVLPSQPVEVEEFAKMTENAVCALDQERCFNILISLTAKDIQQADGKKLVLLFNKAVQQKVVSELVSSLKGPAERLALFLALVSHIHTNLVSRRGVWEVFGSVLNDGSSLSGDQYHYILSQIHNDRWITNDLTPEQCKTILNVLDTEGPSVLNPRYKKALEAQAEKISTVIPSSLHPPAPVAPPPTAPTTPLPVPTAPPPLLPPSPPAPVAPPPTAPTTPLPVPPASPLAPVPAAPVFPIVPRATPITGMPHQAPPDPERTRQKLKRWHGIHGPHSLWGHMMRYIVPEDSSSAVTTATLPPKEEKPLPSAKKEEPKAEKTGGEGKKKAA